MRTPVRRFAGRVMLLDPGSGETMAQFPGLSVSPIIPLSLPAVRHGKLKMDREDVPLYYTWGEMACERTDPPEVAVGTYVLADVTGLLRGEWMVVRWKVIDEQEYNAFTTVLED